MKNILAILLLCGTLTVLAQEFPIATGSYSQTYPSSAFANGKYYNAFLDKSTGSNYGFHAKFIESDGTVLSGDIEIVPPIYNLSFMHEVVWGSTNYLFVWSRGVSGYNRDAYGQIVGSDGYPQGDMFAVSIDNAESASFIETAFDGENFLVVWQEGMPNSGSVIRAQFISEDGQLIGENFSVRPPDLGAEVDQIYPDVEFDGEKYLVVWDDNRNGNRDIYGQFVLTTGELLGEDISIASHASDQLLVQLAFGGYNFYAVWADERLSSNDKSIYGQMINSDGELVGDNLLVSAQSNSQGRTWPDISASNSEYLVVWDQEWLEYDKSSNSNEMLDIFKCEAAGVDDPKPTVWYDVYARKISFQGVATTEELAICTTDYHQQDCDVASDGTDFLVSWSDSRNNNQYSDIYGSIVEGSVYSQLPVISPGEIEFTYVNQFFEGGEQFSIINPNDFEITIDDILFKAPEERYWYIDGNITFPLMIPADTFVELMVNMDLPVGANSIRAFEIDTMLVQSMNEDVSMLLKIDEALLDTIYTIKAGFVEDSIFFQTVDQAIGGITVTLKNYHLPMVTLDDAYTTGPYSMWDVYPEMTLPFPIGFGGEFDFHITSMLPVKGIGDYNEIAVDTLWVSSLGLYWSLPVYYYTEVLDTIWTNLKNPSVINEIHVFPNPAKENISMIIPEGEEIEKLVLINLDGKIVKEWKFTAVYLNGNRQDIDLMNIPKGIYLIEVHTSNQVFTDKLIKY